MKASTFHLGVLIILECMGLSTIAAQEFRLSNGEISARSFVDQAVIVSQYTREQYAHQSSLRIVKGIGYAVYQCNETTPEENKAGQVARMAIFNILNPTATATWVDVAVAGESSNEVTLGGTYVSAPMLHVLNDQTLRIFFTGRLSRDPLSGYRVFYKDYDIQSGKLSGVHAVRCTISKDSNRVMDLAVPAVQSHLDFLFGQGSGIRLPKVSARPVISSHSMDSFTVPFRSKTRTKG